MSDEESGATDGNVPEDGERAPGPVGPTDPAGLLSEMAALRRRTRAARHAYWFPLVLFGLLTAASALFYVFPVHTRAAGTAGTVVAEISGGVPLPMFAGLSAGANQPFLGYYWLAALLGGLLLTLLWYRRHARRAGVQTPARAFIVTSAVLTVLAVVIPLLSQLTGLHFLFIFVALGLVLRGAFASVVIAAGLWVLVRAERSRALAIIAALYTAAALVCALYNAENILFRLGWNPATPEQWQLTALPDVLLPGLVLLIAGAGAFAVQRRRATVQA
jgi:hypothetical protein